MLPDQNAQPEFTPTPEKKRFNIFGISMTVVALVLFCAVIGLGYYAYTLNGSLSTTAAALNTLQSEHGILQSNYATLQGDNAALATTITGLQAELETAKSDLAAAQAEVQTAKDETAALQAKIDDARLRVNVLISFWVEEKTDKGVEADIRETGDTEMLDLYQDFVSSNYNFAELDRWFIYMFEALVTALE